VRAFGGPGAGAQGARNLLAAGYNVGHATITEESSMANPKLKSSLYGRWHIISMSGKSLNEEGQTFIEFRADGYGEFHVGCVQGEFDYRTKHRKGIRVAQFNWAGNDDTEETEGIGWPTP